MTNQKILVVEDDAIEAMDIKRTLESFGYSVPHVADNGKEAVKIIAEIMPDLVLMDILLKGDMDGVEVALEIKKLEIPVIYLTAHSEEANIQKAKLTEPYAYLIKPYDTLELKYAIELAIHKKKSEISLRKSESKYRSLFENSQIAIAITTPDGDLLTANNYFFNTTGYDPEDKDKINVKSMYQDQIERENIINILKKEGEVREYETSLLRKDGQPYLASINVNFIDFQDQKAMLVTGIDITDRALAEDKVQEQAELLEITQDAIILRDTDGKILFWNKGAEDLYGWNREEVKNKITHEVLQTEFPLPYEDLMTEVLSKGQWQGELIHQTKDGNEVVVLSRWALKKNKNDSDCQIMEINRDITSRKKTLQKLEENEERLRQITENINEVFYMHDRKENQFIFVSPAFESIWGVPCQNLYDDPNTFFYYVHPEDQAQLSFAMHQELEHEQFINSEYRIIRPDGEIRWIWARNFPVKSADGEIYRVAGIAEDITQRKEAESKACEIEDKYRLLIKNAEEAIILLDLTGKIVDVNPKALEISGFKKKEIIGKNFIKLLPNIQMSIKDVLSVFKDLVRGDPGKEQYWTMVNKEGKEIHFIAHYSIIKKNGKILGVSCIMEDITGRLKIEKELKESLKEKKVLLSEIHHRVKNNMQIISSLLNLQSTFLDDEKIAEVFLESQNRVKSMAIVHEKLYQSKDLTKIVAADYIKTLIDDLSTSYQIIPGTIKININIDNVKFDIDTSIPLGLLINEITTNSLKHAFPDTKEGQVNIKLQKKEDHELNLIISDDGIGIPANIDPFNTETLGMQLVNNLVRQLDGTMAIKIEKGTEFNIKFKEPIYKNRV